MRETIEIAKNDRAEIFRLARDLAYDQYLTALLARADRRDALVVFAALEGELARIPLQVSDAGIGEIRLQWWRDTLAAGIRTGHPIADAAIATQRLLPAPLADMISPIIEARSAELYAEPFATTEDFEAYVGNPVKASFAIRAALLGQTMPPADPTVHAGARALGLIQTCARLPYLFAKGRYPLSADQFRPSQGEESVDVPALRQGVQGLIAEAAVAWTHVRPQLRRTSHELRQILLPLALAGPYLRGIQKVERDVLRDVVEPSPLERSARLWMAARLGRF